jgi:hypothetical protein
MDRKKEPTKGEVATAVAGLSLGGCILFLIWALPIAAGAMVVYFVARLLGVL